MLKEIYEKEIKEKLTKQFDYKNPMSVPKLSKVTINVGFGKVAADQKAVEAIQTDLVKITGQKPSLRAARAAIASFKIRKGQLIGAKVTLRGKRMWDFVEKMTRIVLPRVRDFRGIAASSFDENGNYTLGFKEKTVFPEIEYTKGDSQSGMEITLTTTTKNKEEAMSLLENLGFPFRKVS
ncbi:MAG: 50S ribosomal protein L5 [bacterium]|nr:50S ribosomal protein L5 [bacterium]